MKVTFTKRNARRVFEFQGWYPKSRSFPLCSSPSTVQCLSSRVFHPSDDTNTEINILRKRMGFLNPEIQPILTDFHLGHARIDYIAKTSERNSCDVTLASPIFFSFEERPRRVVL